MTIGFGRCACWFGQQKHPSCQFSRGIIGRIQIAVNFDIFVHIVIGNTPNSTSRRPKGNVSLGRAPFGTSRVLHISVPLPISVDLPTFRSPTANDRVVRDRLPVQLEMFGPDGGQSTSDSRIPITAGPSADDSGRITAEFRLIHHTRWLGLRGSRLIAQPAEPMAPAR